MDCRYCKLVEKRQVAMKRIWLNAVEGVWLCVKCSYKLPFKKLA